MEIKDIKTGQMLRDAGLKTAAGFTAETVSSVRKNAVHEIKTRENESSEKENAGIVKPHGSAVFKVYDISSTHGKLDKNRDLKGMDKYGSGTGKIPPDTCDNKPSVKTSDCVKMPGNITSAGGSSSGAGLTGPGIAGADIKAQASAETAGRVSDGIRRTCENAEKSFEKAGAGFAGLIIFLVFAGIILIILFSAFGVFCSSGSGDMTVASVAAETQAAYESELQAAAGQYTDGSYDSVSIIYTGSEDGDSPCINNINDVTGVYAVYVTMNSENPSDAVTMDSEKAELFRQIFMSMNSFSVSCQDTAVSETDADGTENTVIHRDIFITLYSAGYTEGAEMYGFSDEMKSMLEEIMNPENAVCFTQLYASEAYSAADMTAVVSGLPAGTKGSMIVNAALSKLGCPYVWGAKGEYSFDCSGLVYWAVSQVDRALGYELYTSAAGQASFFTRRRLAVGYDELMPGDIVFWQKTTCTGCGRWNEIHHTGIYAGNGMVIEASSSKGCVVLRPLWESTGYRLFMFARPCASSG